MRLVRSDNGEMREAEVGHGASDGSNVQGVARRDEDDGDSLALLRSEQGIILEPTS